MTEKTQVNIQVTKDRKERWEEAVKESPEVGTLSGFIRGAVEARINGHTNGTNGHTADSDALNEILEAVQETNSRLNQLEGRVSTVEGLVRGDPEIEEVADSLFEILPTEEELQPRQFERRSGETVAIETSVDSWGDDRNEVPIGDLNDAQLARSGHILGLAEVLGESPYNVEKALENLMEETYVVATTERDGETLYYREE